MNAANDLYYKHDEYIMMKENTIDCNQIQVTSKLASGQFGQVYKGQYEGIIF